MIQTEKMGIKQQQRQATTKQGCYPTLKWCCGKSARDFMATSDSNGQRGRYPLFTSFYPFHTWEIYIETRFQTGCCLHAFILYHIISLIALNYGNLLASWIFHGIPMFPSQVVLSPRIRWLSWQVTRNPRPRQQAWEHLGKSGLVFFFERWGFPGHVPAFWHGISSAFFLLLGPIWSSTYFFQRFDMEFPHVS